MEAVDKQKGMNGNVKGGVQDTKKAVPQATSQTAEAQMPAGEGKTSLLKKWWFWAAIGAVVLIGALVFFLI